MDEDAEYWATSPDEKRKPRTGLERERAWAVMHHSADISHFSLFLDFLFKESDIKQVWTSATSYKWPCAKRIVCWELKLGANRLLLTSSLPLKGWLYHCQNRNSPCPDRFHVIDIGWLFTEVPFPVHIHHGSTRCFILLYPLCHFTAGLSFIIYLACLQLGSSAPQREPFSLGMVTKNTFQFQSSKLSQLQIANVSLSVFILAARVVVQVSLWMSPHPLPLLWCGLSLSLIIAPSYPVSTFWCFLCAHPDRISNKKSLSFWFFAEWVRWPLAFSLHYLVEKKTNWGGNMCKIFWICSLTALLSTALC